MDAKVSDFLFPFKSKRDDFYLKKSTILIKIFSFGIFFVFIYGISQNTISWYEKKLSIFAENFIYTFEMYSKSPCTLDDGAKSLFINDARIVIAKKIGDEFVFKIEECKYKK